MKRHGQKLDAYHQAKEASLKRLPVLCYVIWYDCNHITSGKSAAMETVKRSVGARGLGGGVNRQGTGVFGQYSCSLWYCDGEHLSLFICLNPQNVQHEGSALMEPRNFGWLSCVNIDSPLTTTGPLLWGIFIMGETMFVWRQGVCGKSPPQFCCESKTSKKSIKS